MKKQPFRRVHAMLNSVRECLSSHTSQCLTRAAELVTSPPCTAWQRSDSKLPTGKRRNQDLMFGADQFLVVSQRHGDVQADHVPDHGRPVPLPVPTTQSPCLRARGCRALIGMISRHCGRLVALVGRTQIVRFGVTSGSHMKDQVADHIGSRSLPELRVVTVRCRLAVIQCVRLPGQGR